LIILGEPAEGRPKSEIGGPWDPFIFSFFVFHLFK
jgi:hypothetical protein